MRFAAVYSYVAKEGSRELRSGIKTLEETVKSVVGPVNEKFRLVPDEILRQVDTNQNRTGRGSPASTRTAASEMARRLSTKYEPVAEQCVASAWEKVKQSPLFPRVSNAVVHKAEYCTEKYNDVVVTAADKGCRVSEYLRRG